MSWDVAITGVSAFTPCGVGVEVLEKTLLDGQVCIRPTPNFPSVGAATIEDFDPQRYATVRGMRIYPRTIQLEICAAHLALADAGLLNSTLDSNDLGLVTASSFSHLETLIEYDRGLVTLGMQRTNPTLMPLGLPSAPGAGTALSLPAKAFSITVNDGGAAGLAALGVAARALASGRARVCVVAGAFSLFSELLQSASLSGELSSADSFRVLDQRSAGFTFGDAAAALVLEPGEFAKARGRPPRGFLRAEASRFAVDTNGLPTALGRAAEAALRTARIETRSLAVACVGANGTASDDAAHAQVLYQVLGDDAPRIPVVAPKANLGESFDPSGLIQAIVALSALRSRIAPPLARLERPRVPGLRYPSQPTELDGDAALLTAISPSGSCSALILSRDDD